MIDMKDSSTSSQSSRVRQTKSLSMGSQLTSPLCVVLPFTVRSCVSGKEFSLRENYLSRFALGLPKGKLNSLRPLNINASYNQWRFRRF